MCISTGSSLSLILLKLRAEPVSHTKNTGLQRQSASAKCSVFHWSRLVSAALQPELYQSLRLTKTQHPQQDSIKALSLLVSSLQAAHKAVSVMLYLCAEGGLFHLQGPCHSHLIWVNLKTSSCVCVSVKTEETFLWMKPQWLAACFYQTARHTETTTTHLPHSAADASSCPA